MGAAVPLVPVKLAVVALESFCYGVFLILSCLSLYLLVQRERALNSRRWLRSLVINPLVVASLLMILSVTAHWILTIYRSFMAFIYFDSGASPALYYSSLADTSYVLQNGLLDLSLFMFDAVMIYRVWVIWDRNLLPVLVPLCLEIGALVSCIGSNVELTRFQVGAGTYLTHLASWIGSAAIITLLTNVTCASLTAWKLWRSHSRIKAHGINLLWILSVVVESAAIYVTWSILFVSIYESDTNVNFVFSDLWPVVAGIAFMLINVRVGAGWGKHNQYQSSEGHSQIFAQGDSHRPLGYEMNPVAVVVTSVTEQDQRSTKDSKLEKTITRSSGTDTFV